jgi:hypothetical protein
LRKTHGGSPWRAERNDAQSLSTVDEKSLKPSPQIADGDESQQNSCQKSLAILGLCLSVVVKGVGLKTISTSSSATRIVFAGMRGEAPIHAAPWDKKRRPVKTGPLIYAVTFLRRPAFRLRVAFLRVDFLRIDFLRIAFFRLTFFRPATLRADLRAAFFLGLGGRLIPTYCRRLERTARLIFLWGWRLNLVPNH